jgi:Flp pilus assembly protein TadG
MKNIIKLPKNSEKGQSIVLIALVFVGLLAFIGLTVDLGVLFISYGNLRRAVDNAALAAATQMRTSYTNDEIKSSAAQFLRLNNVMVDEGSVNVQTCDTNPGDVQLCPADKRKLVRVSASVPIKFSFLPVIGFYGTTISANAIAEAASMDVVLVIDISESMTVQSTGFNMKDPVVCNADNSSNDTDDHPEIVDSGGTHYSIPGECHPFEEVKAAAAWVFARSILDKPASEEEDRIAIVVFSDGWESHNYFVHNGAYIPTTGTGVVCPSNNFDSDGNCKDPWINDYNQAYDIITNLKVYEGGSVQCPDDIVSRNEPGLCSVYDNSTTPATYQGSDCPYSYADTAHAGNIPMADYSTCWTTNIGGGLRNAAALFGINMHKDALWLVLLLTDGSANATDVTNASNPGLINASGNPIVDYYHQIRFNMPVGYCPNNGVINVTGSCRDNLVSTRHDHLADPTHYDADDYARDEADLVSCDPKSPKAGCSQAGQGAIMFSIGLGNVVITAKDSAGVSYGDSLLRYIANVGDDGDPSAASDPCSGQGVVSTGYTCGNYYFASSGSDLQKVFKQIASRVFTRLTK